MTSIKWYKKLNLLWWFYNSDQPDPDPNVIFLPHAPQWFRKLWWLMVRNPLHNFFYYVIGLMDRPTRVEGTYPFKVFAPSGYNKTKTYVEGCGIGFPFISYKGKKVMWYAGWRPNEDYHEGYAYNGGCFGMKFVKARDDT